MGPFNGVGWRDTHVHERVDLYLTGALPAPARSRFEAHLLRCAGCRTVADRHSEIAVLVAALPAEAVAELERISSGRTQPSRGVVVPVAALMLGVVLGAGGCYAVLPSAGASDEGAATVRVGSRTGPRRGTLSVTVADRPGGGADVRAVAVGLQAGDGFELYAVGRDGQNYVAARGTAAGGPTSIVGAVPVAPGHVRFFALVLFSGEVFQVADAA
ncbi:zf-HC2 domain-containing protein [Dactylosporangium sp. NPDC005555]|uniref:zf-HC2 domain-containing protein n=1 Tax=Dactylosporangium sp. NPDC005555 TaxID=3154889 RepID=UPI0033B26CE5